MNQRFYSLDVFRGATVAFMILVNNPGTWSAIFSPLKHAGWHGCTPTDLVFPFFLFAVGNAIAFVLPKMEKMSQAAAVGKILKRGALIFLIGLLLNWFPFVKWQDGELVGKSFHDLRIFGVLQRIALAYTAAALIIYFFKVRGSFYLATLLLLGYWVITAMAGDPADPYSLEGFWGTHLDRALLGDSHLYHGEGVAFDPEGLASTIPSIAQVIFGFLVGDYIRTRGGKGVQVPGDVTSKVSDERVMGISGSQTSDTGSAAGTGSAAATGGSFVANLFVAGVVLWLAGMAWGLVFPINKKIWTSSYVLYTVGLAILVLATLVQLIEFRGWKGRWSEFFNAFGKNPLFIYVLSGLIPKTLALIRIPDGTNAEGEPRFTSPLGWFYQYICKPIFEKPEAASLLYAIVFVVVLWAIAWWMDRKKIYVRV